MNRPADLLLALLRSALWDMPMPDSLLENSGEGLWRETMRLASAGGITALAFEGVKRLPAALQPPRDVKITWGLNAENLVEKHLRQEDTAIRLAAFYASGGIRTMLLKGIAAARHYPMPRLRECGDIDFWLFGDYEKGNRMAGERGIRVKTDNAKHAAFTFEGVPVENHATLLDETVYAMDRRIGRKLQDILQNEPAMLHRDGYLLPPADFDALFLLRHAGQHFAVEGIALRHAVDWACFLNAQEGCFDRKAFLKTLREEGLENFAGALTGLCCLYLGLPPEKSPLPVYKYEKNAARMLNDMLNGKAVCPQGGMAGVLAFKTRRLLGGQWRYRMVYGRFSFWSRILSSAKRNLKKPDTILKAR